MALDSSFTPYYWQDPYVPYFKFAFEQFLSSLPPSLLNCNHPLF